MPTLVTDRLRVSSQRPQITLLYAQTTTARPFQTGPVLVIDILMWDAESELEWGVRAKRRIAQLKVERRVEQIWQLVELSSGDIRAPGYGKKTVAEIKRYLEEVRLGLGISFTPELRQVLRSPRTGQISDDPEHQKGYVRELCTIRAALLRDAGNEEEAMYYEQVLAGIDRPQIDPLALLYELRLRPFVP